MVRRGRLKIDRVDNYTSIVFQLDATQNGLQLMDAFIQLREPKYKEINLPLVYSTAHLVFYRLFFWL